MNYADDMGYQGIVRSGMKVTLMLYDVSGALLAIGKFRTQDAYDFLKARVPYGEEIEFARPAAVKAFAEVV